MNKTGFDARYQKYLEAIEDYLSGLFAEKPHWADLYEAMRYSLLSGGKRLRPVLTLEFARLAGEEGFDWYDAMPAACAVEMVHTYSLIHDDLPCMDNDDLRRGKPTNHKIYGETLAVLAGDALQAAAFQTVLSASGPWRRNGQYAPAVAAGLLAEAAGEGGMCGGQYLDTVGDRKVIHTAEELTAINDKKTGALLRAACMMGVAAAAGRRTVDGSCMDAARDYATYLGLAFQIRDDMLDVMGDQAEFGKPIGSDAEQGKSTYVSILGLEECEKRVLALTEQAKAALETVANFDAGKLIDAGKVDDLKMEIKKSYDGKISDLEKALADSKKDSADRLAAKEASIRTLLVKGIFDSSAFLKDKTVLPSDVAYASFGRHFEVKEENGELRVVATMNGQPIFSRSDPGTLATPEEALEAIIDKYPMKDRILKAPDGGSGSHPNAAYAPGAKIIPKGDMSAFGANLEAIAKGEVTVAAQ